jgi:VanZ family protein
MQSAVRIAQILFVLLAMIVGFNIWSADNGVSNAVLEWLRHVRHGDKYAHFLLYGALAFLLHIALRGKCWRAGPLPVPAAAVFVLVFGLVEEFSQLYWPQRKFDWIDLACNLGGVVFFMVLAHGAMLLLRRAEARRSKQIP